VQVEADAVALGEAEHAGDLLGVDQVFGVYQHGQKILYARRMTVTPTR
jgi:hypothetical protein